MLKTLSSVFGKKEKEKKKTHQKFSFCFVIVVVVVVLLYEDKHKTNIFCFVLFLNCKRTKTKQQTGLFLSYEKNKQVVLFRPVKSLFHF